MRRSTVTILVVVLCASGAEAAVRVCNPEVTSGPRTEEDEGAARKAAFEAWTKAAAAYGPQFTRWQIAERRAIVCQPSANRVQCEARGMPCTIRQAPLPPGDLEVLPKPQPDAIPEPRPPSGKGISG